MKANAINNNNLKFSKNNKKRRKENLKKEFVKTTTTIIILELEALTISHNNIFIKINHQSININNTNNNSTMDKTL